MSVGENQFERAAAQARQQRAVAPAVGGLRPAWLVEYRNLNDKEAVIRGMGLAELLDGPSTRTAEEFLDFADKRRNIGSTALRSRYGDWAGTGYPIPYLNRAGLYLCTDGQLRGGYMGEEGLVSRAQPTKWGQSLHDQPKFYTGAEETWVRKVTAKYPSPGDDGMANNESSHNTQVRGEVRREYRRPSAAQVLTAYAVEMDRLGEDVPSLYEALPDLAKPAFVALTTRNVEPPEGPMYGYEPTVSNTGIIYPRDGEIVGTIIGTPLNAWQHTF